MKVTRPKRVAALAGVAALLVGGAMLGSAQAHATPIGTQLGAVSLHDPAFTGSGLPSGKTNDTGLTYTTTQACPSGFQGSAVLRAVDPQNNTNTSSLSNATDPATTPVSGAWTDSIPDGNLDLMVSAIIPDIPGTTTELVVVCFSGASLTGSSMPFQDTYIQVAATPNSDGSFNWTETNTVAASPTPVNVTLQASPSPATVGASVTLTAHVTPATATGSVDFKNGATDVGTQPIAAGGVATIQTSFATALASPGYSLTATYVPPTPNPGNFTVGTVGTASEVVNAAPANAGNIPLAVLVPSAGTFTLTVDTTDWVTLSIVNTTTPTEATGVTTAITAQDTRNTYPGWSVSGQSQAFTGTIPVAPPNYPYSTTGLAADHGSQSFGADNLGWTPTGSIGAVTLGTTAVAGSNGVTLGAPIAKGTSPNGLGDAARVLASVTGGPAGAGTGTYTLGANLDLNIPVGQEAGPYASFLDITSVNHNP